MCCSHHSTAKGGNHCILEATCCRREVLANVFAPTIDHYVVQANVKRRKKRAEKAVIYTEESASLDTQSA